ncbi:unnamed protein product [Ceutorhynchus assimilis]|uniref:Nucleolar 27S pre-rRNA processing Urb2/Npa2 C-terminal domain-containing protein n=1 Tax=Ceutorhynchus assimilis TaxID=467358 RepID=A0A9N9QRZ9_9CUCU|nr:unnamed protein product [Ceutorhynchus assimilis]
MSLPGGLLKILDNEAEPLNKRLKIADNAFKAQEIHARHKEALLLNWILDKSASIPDEELLSLGNQWVLSKEFRELNQNDITNENISSIIELIQKKLADQKLSTNNLQKVTNLILSLCENQIFQQYFKYNLESYCNLIAVALQAIALPGDYIGFIAKPFLFPKHLIVQENFLKQFLDSIFSVLVQKALMFNNDPQVVNETVQIIQKCLLQGNIKHFQNFFDNIFIDEANGTSTIAKPVFKRLFAFLQEDNAIARTSLSLFFAAFSASFKDPQLIFKCFIFLFGGLQFDVSNRFSMKIPFKQKLSLPLSKSMDVLLGLLSALGSNNSFTDCTFSNISFTEFLRSILKTLVTLKPQNNTVLEIILSCIAINPLIIEPLASGLTTFVMLANRESKEIYEKVVIAIFEVFAKLHRVENFIAKIIPALKNAIIEQKSESYEQTYNFGGIVDSLEVNPGINEIFTTNILACFTKCLNSLASWQSINIFATITYHLKAAIEDYTSNDTNKFIFLEILGVLMGCFLQSIKIADHSIPLNVVAKFVKGLEELREILKNFGPAILKTEHNHIAMRTFLNLSYVWAEVYITLAYYSMNNEVQMATVMDKTYSAANLKYLHSYMDIKQWQLIAQRISNFGEYPCKKLLQKLYIQKLRSILLFEKEMNDEITINIVKTLQTHLDDTWRDLLSDKFTVNFLVPKMDKTSLTFLAEHLIEEDALINTNHILDSSTLTKATVYVLLTKINKLCKGKRKHNGEQNISLSSKLFASYPEEIFFDSEDSLKITNLEDITNLYNGCDVQNSSTIINKEDKLQNYMNILKKVPFIYSNVNIQKLVLLYFMSLNVDIQNCSEDTRTLLEDLIIGTLRACKFPLTEIFNIKVLCAQILKNFNKHELLFNLSIDNVFKCEKSIMQFEPLVLYLTKHLQNINHLNSSISVLQAITKIKKSKIDQSAKEKLNQYKDTILTKMSKFVCKSEYSVEAYATCLKHYLTLENSSETLKQLLEKLDSYLNYALENISNENKHECALLFNAILQNKTKINSADNIVLRIWTACKKVDIGEEDCQLVRLIVTLIANEEFEILVKDLFDNTDASIKSQNKQHLVRQLKNWKSILTVDVNPVKMKIWQDVLENLVYELLHILKTNEYDEQLFKGIVQLKQSIIQTQHFILSPPLIDMFIMTPQVLIKHEHQHFEQVFSMSISTLEMLLKYRNATIMDRLPAFLQQYRILLKSITDYSNSDSSEKKLDPKVASDCVHTLEKLTKNLVWCKKDMGRIAVFLIADILQTYEQINLYPNVKLHLNNCVYSLISLCDHHAISYLMRALSSASTEMFKIMYDHYKKYYMFTGKV